MPQTKAQLRQQMRTRLADLPDPVRAQASDAICRHVAASACWRQARAVMCFVPMAAEVQIGPLLELAWSQRKVLACPHVDWDRRIMTARSLDDWSGLAVGKYSTMQSPEGQTIEPHRLDLVLVPGLAFDSEGFRLGRGGGYYDRFLSDFSGATCGLAFDCQRVDQLPREPHDLPVRMLITEQGIVRFG